MKICWNPDSYREEVGRQKLGVGSPKSEVGSREFGYRKFRRFVCHSERISTKFVEILV